MVLKTAVVALLVVGFVVAGNPSIVHIGMDDMMMPETMPGCPLMGMSAVCQMSPLEHLGMWQNLFTFLPKVEDLFAALIVFLTLALGATWFSWLPRRIPKTDVRYRIRHGYVPPHRSLQELFSSGILHSKAF